MSYQEWHHRLHAALFQIKWILEVNVYSSLEKGMYFVSILDQLSVFKWDFCKENVLIMDTAVLACKGQTLQITDGKIPDVLNLCGKM